MLAHAIIYILVYREKIVVVFGAVHPSLGDIQVHAIITRFRYSHSVMFEGLNVNLQSALRLSTNTEVNSIPLDLAPLRCGRLRFQR